MENTPKETVEALVQATKDAKNLTPPMTRTQSAMWGALSGTGFGICLYHMMTSPGTAVWWIIGFVLGTPAFFGYADEFIEYPKKRADFEAKRKFALDLMKELKRLDRDI